MCGPRMKRFWAVRCAGSLTTLSVLAVVTLATACGGGGDRHARTPADAAEIVPPVTSEQGAAQSEIVLFFPGTEDDLLHAETRTVVPIEAAEDRAKLCLEELFRGPSPGLLAAVPEGVQVREVYILEDGTAYADFSSGLAGKLNGSTREILTVYAIVDTLAVNFPALKRIGILVDGSLQESLGGHLYTGRPLLPDFQYVEASARPKGEGGASRSAGPAPTGEAGGTAAGGDASDQEGDATGKGHPDRPEGDSSGDGAPDRQDGDSGTPPPPPAGEPV